jgi:hypothetical protein
MKKPEKKPTKRQEEYTRSLRRDMAKEMAEKIRRTKKEMFEKVRNKEKLETLDDVYYLFCGLSRAAVEISAIGIIRELAVRGCSPAKIVEILEPPKRMPFKEAGPQRGA